MYCTNSAHDLVIFSGTIPSLLLELGLDLYCGAAMADAINTQRITFIAILFFNLMNRWNNSYSDQYFAD